MKKDQIDETVQTLLRSAAAFMKVQFESELRPLAVGDIVVCLHPHDGHTVAGEQYEVADIEYVDGTPCLVLDADSIFCWPASDFIHVSQFETWQKAIAVPQAQPEIVEKPRHVMAAAFAAIGAIIVLSWCVTQLVELWL